MSESRAAASQIVDVGDVDTQRGVAHPLAGGYATCRAEPLGGSAALWPTLWVGSGIAGQADLTPDSPGGQPVSRSSPTASGGAPGGSASNPPSNPQQNWGAPGERRGRINYLTVVLTWSSFRAESFSKSLKGKAMRSIGHTWSIAVVVVATFCGTGLAQSSDSLGNNSWSDKGRKSEFRTTGAFTRAHLSNIAADLQRVVGRNSAPSTGSTSTGGLAGLVGINRLQAKPLVNRVPTALSLESCTIKWDTANGTPTFVTGAGLQRSNLSATANQTDQQAVLSFFETNKLLFRIDSPTDELTVAREHVDKLGKTHIVFQQVYEGIPVWGREIAVHLDANHEMYAINARYSPSPRGLDLTAGRIPAQQAIDYTIRDLSARGPIRVFGTDLKRLLEYDGPAATLSIWIDRETQKPRLVWHVSVRPNIRDLWYYFVDANSGEVLESYNATCFDGPAVATAIDLNGVTQNLNVYYVAPTYYMIDASRPIWEATQPNIIERPRGALWTVDAQNTDLDSIDNVTSASNTWVDPASVSAHYNMSQTFNYYYTTFGRLAIDDSGSTMISIVHVTEGGASLGNAYWNGIFISYGDGDANFKPLAGALDVAAHEITHGVVQYTVNLEPGFQSGALNESLADVFGAMVDRTDWFIGEDVVRLTAFPSGALRNMADPHNGGSGPGDAGWQPSNMSEYQDISITEDRGGEHLNSGITNRAAYLIGTTIGKDKLEQVYYRILDAGYLNRLAEFIDMRLAAILAAGELYGNPSAEVAAVESAFSTVGIGDGPGTGQPPDVAPIEGEQWVAVVNADVSDSSLYLVNPDVPATEIKQLTTTQVFTGTGCPITTPRDGSFIIFVDSAHFLRAVRSDGVGEAVISETGEWWSVALSPDGTKLAATSIYIDSSIFILDLVNPDSSKVFHLYSPGTEGGSIFTTVFADALDWDLAGQYVLYDAFNSVAQSGGGAIDYWDINMLSANYGVVFPVFPSLPAGIQIGNPAFASTNDVFFAFDLIDANTGQEQVQAVNLFTGDLGLIEDNGSSVGLPDYSPDDSRVVFQRFDAGHLTLRQIAVDSTKITPTGASVAWVQDAMRPAWFTIRSLVDVDSDDEAATLPTSYGLSQNYPNPFNPLTEIKFSLPVATEVRLEVFNVLGQTVAALVGKRLGAGEHTVTWDATGQASGVYLYHLTAGEFVETKKMVLLK